MSTDNNMRDVPISLEFDHTRRVGQVGLYQFVDDLPNPAEYVLSPELEYDTETKQWAITGYGMVHITHLPTFDQLKEKMKGVTG